MKTYYYYYYEEGRHDGPQFNKAIRFCGDDPILVYREVETAVLKDIVDCEMSTQFDDEIIGTLYFHDYKLGSAFDRETLDDMVESGTCERHALKLDISWSIFWTKDD